MKKCALLFAGLAVFAAASAKAHVANLKVVTDANPDYSDMESMVHSITANWKTDAEKMYALFYWDHIGLRHSVGVERHGYPITDPIRLLNDYGYAHFVNAAGVKTSEWLYMGYPCRLIGQSPEVWYDGRFHMYDNAYSMIYSLEDGKTIASVADLAKSIAGPETGGKPVRGYLVLYHALTGTSANGFFQGGDWEHMLRDEIPDAHEETQATYRQQRGHRYILNLRDGEMYTRYYHRLDAHSPHAIVLDNEASEYKADPAAFVHMGRTGDNHPADPEVNEPAFHVRGNGERTFSPLLDKKHLATAAWSTENIQPLAPGLAPAAAGKPAEAIFKIEGSNVITSAKVRAFITTATADDSATISLSTNNGITWKEIWKSSNTGDNEADLQLIDEVNGVYDFLIKATLNAKNNPADVQLKSIAFNAWTEINSKTQPRLNIGANTIYVGQGEQSQSIVLEPELQHGRYKTDVFDEKNIKVAHEFWGQYGVLSAQDQRSDAYLTFKIDAPTDITSLTYGGHFANGGGESHVDFLHSFDNGKTWITDHAITGHPEPNDVIHYERITDVPPGCKSVLIKYLLSSGDGANGHNTANIFALRMEVDHKLPESAQPPRPLEITFHWRERQKNWSWVRRSHTQLVEKLPFTYMINVGGVDQPEVDSLAVSLKGTRPDPHYGYNDGVDPAIKNPELGKKWIGTWETVGNDLALHKPYTLSVPSGNNWGAGDPHNKKLTDGVVGSSFSAGYQYGAIWAENQKPEITVDLGEKQKCAAFRIHLLGFPNRDAIRGQIEDTVEVLTSVDGKDYQSAGEFNLKPYRKDIPLNFMIPDNDALTGFNFVLRPDAPIEARYVKYKLTPRRYLDVTEVQVLDNYTVEPFSMNIALPDPATNGQAPPNPDVSPNAKQWSPADLPKR